MARAAGLARSAPGYVGYGEGGVLTEAVRRQPHSVVLLDEVEKAHPDVLEMFFRVFDKDVMDDAEGREIRTAKRLEREHAHTYRAAANVTTPHNITKLSFDAEVTALKKAPPNWVRVTKSGRHLPAQKPPTVPPGHFDIGDATPAPGARNSYETFAADVPPDRLPTGTKIYRVLDPRLQTTASAG